MNNILAYIKGKIAASNAVLLPIAAFMLPMAMLTTACSEMLENDSEIVEFTEDNKLNTPEDTLHSTLGIIRQMQVIADRNLLLGELRGDLMVTTDKATTDIKKMAAFDFNGNNAYNKVADYYAIINSCNYFIANADVNLMKLSKKIFDKEFAAVKTYRAWTYLQLAKIYGNVPLVTEPILTENDAQQEINKQYSSIKDICNYFIEDLKPYVDTEMPNYDQMGDFQSRKFFIPVRVLLGEMCLWAGRYQEACEYFANYLTKKTAPIPTYVNSTSWNVTNLDFTTAYVSNSFLTSVSSYGGSEIISFIPMETSEFYGIKSFIEDVYESNENNNYYFQATPSPAMRELSAAENYCLVDQTSDTQKDTVYAPKANLPKSIQAGDLRLSVSYESFVSNQDEYSEYASDRQTINKVTSEALTIYRVQRVYLLFAEALCRAGYPESAFCILKYGLYRQAMERYISPAERERAGSLLAFNDDSFDEYTCQGIHARGCGDVECDTLYCLPQPETALASYEDTVQYQIPLLEDMIVREMALEGAFEGWRYYDLMRIALRRNDASYLAAPIAKRSGSIDNALYDMLMEQKNWYLPLQ